VKPRTLAIIVGVLVVILIGFVLFPLPQPIIEVKPEKLFSIGGFDVTNTIFTAWVMVILISLVTILGTRKLTLVPSGFQNLFEAVVEAFRTITEDVAGQVHGRRFLPVAFAFFLYILLCNWAALTPLFAVIGVTDNLSEHIHEEASEHPDEHVSKEEKIEGWVMTEKSGIGLVPLFQDIKLVEVDVPEGTTFAQREELLKEATREELGRELHEDEFVGFIAPFLRGVNTDLNATLSYAIWSAIFVETWGIAALGLFAYGSRFFNFRSPIDFFVGILELISELARLISFTFRLFGNIFAGEVLLFMISFLIPWVIVSVFFGLELFIGLIQAFVFAMLTLVFASMAVSGHDDHNGHGEEQGAPGHAISEAGH
jgi:F-type H+-transporting ATPase subunit a